MRVARVVPFLAVIVVLSAGAGLLFDVLTRSTHRPVGMIYGACIGLTVMLFERGLVLSGAQNRIRRLPTWAFVPISEAAMFTVVLCGIAIGGTVVWLSGLAPIGFAEAIRPTTPILIYSLLVSGVMVSIGRVRDLLGHEVFNNLLVGRYHKPVKERRIFLFLDVVGSTAYARRHGDLRAQELLGAIFDVMADPVHAHCGTIDDYVGDMAMITWPEPRGLQDARCLRCVFAILDAIESTADDWARRFGQVPRLHGALHGGPVVVAEVGVDRHKISYFGDVVNTTARIEALTGQIGSGLLISSELLESLGPLPDGYIATSRGEHMLKGRDAALEVFSLVRSRVRETAAGTVLQDVTAA